MGGSTPKIYEIDFNGLQPLGLTLLKKSRQAINNQIIS
jgi:hypothetical protein